MPQVLEFRWGTANTLGYHNSSPYSVLHKYELYPMTLRRFEARKFLTFPTDGLTSSLQSCITNVTTCWKADNKGVR